MWVFGSRANNTKKKYSDLDLAINAPTKLSLSTLASLEHDFSESNLPYKVDIIDKNNIEKAFIENIKSIIFQK